MLPDFAINTDSVIGIFARSGSGGPASDCPQTQFGSQPFFRILMLRGNFSAQRTSSKAIPFIPKGPLVLAAWPPRFRRIANWPLMTQARKRCGSFNQFDTNLFGNVPSIQICSGRLAVVLKAYCDSFSSPNAASRGADRRGGEEHLGQAYRKARSSHDGQRVNLIGQDQVFPAVPALPTKASEGFRPVLARWHFACFPFRIRHRALRISAKA